MPLQSYLIGVTAKLGQNTGKMIDDIYNKDVLRLAANISRVEPLDAPDAEVTATSPLCGSSITVQLCVNDGKVSGYGQKIKACALGQAAASVMADVVIGLGRKDIETLQKQLAAMLAGKGAALNGIWSALAALEPAQAATARHGAILLPAKAVLAAWDEIDAAASRQDSL